MEEIQRQRQRQPPQHRTERRRLRQPLRRRGPSAPRCFLLVEASILVSILLLACLGGRSVEAFVPLPCTDARVSYRFQPAPLSFWLDGDLRQLRARASATTTSVRTSLQKRALQEEEQVSERKDGDSDTDEIRPARATAASKWNDDDFETYQVNLQLAALANDCATRRNVTAAREACSLLRSMERPDSVAYNSVLKALAKISPADISQDRVASQVAEDLLIEMKELHQHQVEANAAWYEQMAVGGLSDEDLEAGPPRVRVKPNVRTYATVMDALGRSGDEAAAQRAGELLKNLQEHYETTGDGALQPNLIAYNTLLSAYANSGQALRCLETLREMPMAPDIISHNAVLHALARSSHQPDKAGPRAEAYLRKITNVSPNARSYSTCMDAWSQSGQPDCAHRLLQEMMQAYRQSGRDPSLKPNAITYSTIIHGYAVSDDPEKALHAFQIWREMQKEGVKPNGVTLNNVLNACATTRPPTPIVRRMIQSLYQYALRHGQPDEVTFGIVLKACENWRDDLTLCPSEVFAEACLRGMVSSGVLHHLRQAVTISTFRSLVGDSGSWADLPESWRRRVRHSGARLGRRRR